MAAASSSSGRGRGTGAGEDTVSGATTGGLKMANIQQQPERPPMDYKLLEALIDGIQYEMLDPAPPPANQDEENSAEWLMQGVTSEGNGVLHIAAKFEHVNLVKDIFRRWRDAVDVAAKNKKGATALHYAAATGNVNMITLLISFAGADANKRQLLREQRNNGETCLHEAVRCGKGDAVKILVEQDVSFYVPDRSHVLVNIHNNEGVSPLYMATTLCETEIVQFLIEQHGPAGRYPAASYDGPGSKTALHAAVLRSQDLSKLLAEWNKELIGKSDLSGNTPLHLLASTNDRIIADHLLDLDPSAGYRPDNEGSLPIHVAAANGRLEILKLLSKRRSACAWSTNNLGQTILHIAVREKRYNVVNYVCSEPKLVRICNATDTNGNTALHLAVIEGDHSIFCQLMKRREVCLSFTNKDELTPLDLAQLNIPPGLQSATGMYLVMNSLIVAGAHWGTCRHDHLLRNMAKREEEKESKKIGKSAGVLGVCAVLILTTAFAAPFTVAHYFYQKEEKNIAMRFAFRIFTMADVAAFGFSAASISSFTFAGFPFLDQPKRYMYFDTGYLFLLFAAMFMMLVFLGGVYLAVRPLVDSATLVYIYVPGVLLPCTFVLKRALGSRVLLHARALDSRIGYFHIFRGRHYKRLFGYVIVIVFIAGLALVLAKFNIPA